MLFGLHHIFFVDRPLSALSVLNLALLTKTMPEVSAHRQVSDWLLNQKGIPALKFYLCDDNATS